MPGTTLTHLGAESPPPRPPSGVFGQRLQACSRCSARVCSNVRHFPACFARSNCRNRNAVTVFLNSRRARVIAIKIQSRPPSAA